MPADADDLFWADQLADDIIDEKGEKESYVFSAGMSVSGKMHIGNLRGELVIPSRVRTIFADDDRQVTFRGVYYTQDQFKAKDEQLAKFDDPEAAEQYAGWRLIDVPDPEGCHDNWVEHFNAENHPYLERFGIRVDPITTTEFYRMDETKELVRTFLDDRERVRDILNEFRDRNPYPDDWIPFNPLCTACNRIDETEAEEIDFDGDRVRYHCNACGEEGWSPLEKGKLAWRLEWSALWHVLGVDFEPYGKDHATPGGSRDSCKALSDAFDLNVPVGFSFNWVYLKDEEGDVREMTSSGDVGITAREWLNLAEPEVLTYLYCSTRPMTEIYFAPHELPTYYRRFDRAERVYFGEEDLEDEKQAHNMSRAYELAVQDVPDEQPVRVDFEHAVFVAQTVPREKWEGRGLDVLRRTGHVPEHLSDANRERVLQRLTHAAAWADEHAPAEYVYTFNEAVPESVREALSDDQLAAMHELHALLEEREYEDKGALEDDLFDIARDGPISVGDFFNAAYNCLLSRDNGPRLADFIMTRGQDSVVDALATLDG